MKANELMIGDWVIDTRKNCERKPIQITGESFVKAKADGAYARSVIECDPIPLTPEILEKNFEKKTFYGIYDDYFDLDIWEYSDGLYIVTYHSCEFNIPDQTIHLSWVHELQHFMRLCGIEKEIEL